MIARRFLTGTTLAALTVAAAVFAASTPVEWPATGTTPVELAALSQPSSGLAPAAPVAGMVPLREFETPGGGWFYTLNPTEAQDAIAKFKFTKSADIGKMYASPVAGGIAVHRLRARSGPPSYLLSTVTSEIHNPAFVDEGVLGYVDSQQRPGEVRLMRFAKQGKWRVLADGPANVNNMKAAGYTVDGALGWYQP